MSRTISIHLAVIVLLSNFAHAADAPCELAQVKMTALTEGSTVVLAGSGKHIKVICRIKG